MASDHFSIFNKDGSSLLFEKFGDDNWSVSHSLFKKDAPYLLKLMHNSFDPSSIDAVWYNRAAKQIFNEKVEIKPEKTHGVLMYISPFREDRPAPPPYVSLLSKINPSTQDACQNAILDKIVQNKVVVFGEMHSSETQRMMLADEMGYLYAAGVRVIGLEFFFSDMQGMIDGKKYDRMFAYLNENWDWDFQTAISILTLVKEAQKHGIRVVCLDMPEKVQKSQEEEVNKNGQVYSNLANRDEWMANKAKPYLDNGKMVILCGDAHRSGITDNLRLNNVTVSSVSFIGGDPSGTNPMERAAREVDELSNSWFIVKGTDDPNYVAAWYPDLFIHMPQLEEPSKHAIPYRR